MAVWTHVLQEEVQLRVAAGVDRCLKQREEDVLQHLLEVGQLFLGAVDIAVGREEERRGVTNLPLKMI